MRATVQKSTSNMCFNICQAAIIGIVITAKDDKPMFGLPPFAWLICIAIVSYMLAWRFSVSAEIKEKTEAKQEKEQDLLRSKKRKNGK